MNSLLIWLVTALYTAQAGICFWNGQPPQGTILIGYALANVGLIWSMR